MTTIPPRIDATSNLLSTHRSLVDTLSSFLTVLTHQILFLRLIYPPASFLSCRAYNFPVRQNRHPEVCAWINDAIASVRDQLERGTVETVSVVIFEIEGNRVLERWSVDVRNVPVVGRKERDVPFASVDDEDGELRRKINLVDLEASFRGMLNRLGVVAGKMKSLPGREEGVECSFTITIEVKDGHDRPVGRLDERERNWVVAEPDAWDGVDRDGDETPSKNGGAMKVQGPRGGKTHAVRRLEAGELRLEMFVEESEYKEQMPSTWKSTLERSKELSYGAGNEKFADSIGFDPENGYEDAEEKDIYKKPSDATGYQRG